MTTNLLLIGSATLLAACGGNGSSCGASGARQNVVGSSTVYPFTTAIAEEFQRARPGTSVTVESTGTEAGPKLFCAGVGENFPDLTSASRQIKISEFEDCNKHKVKQIIEFPIGIDGLTVIESILYDDAAISADGDRKYNVDMFRLRSQVDFLLSFQSISRPKGGPLRRTG